MSDEVEVIVIPDPGVVAVPQPDIDVVTTEISTPVIIESPTFDVVTIEDEDHIVDQVREIQIVTVGEQGPPGIGGTGVASSGLTLRTDRYVAVVINGTTYKLAEVN